MDFVLISWKSHEFINRREKSSKIQFTRNLQSSLLFFIVIFAIFSSKSKALVVPGNFPTSFLSKFSGPNSRNIHLKSPGRHLNTFFEAKTRSFSVLTAHRSYSSIASTVAGTTKHFSRGRSLYTSSRHSSMSLSCSTGSDELSQHHFDYLVIGGGSGGVASARRAASYGAKVGLIEKQSLGGTCVNLGCVPKKVMYNAACVADNLHNAMHFGFETGSVNFHWNRLKISRDGYVHRLNSIYENMLKGSQVELIRGKASFCGSKRVILNGKEGHEITADHILIAVGGVPTMPNIPGIEHCITSDGFFDLEHQPQSVAVIGAGYISVELAGIFHALGTQTTLITRGSRPLRGFEEFIVTGLMTEMQKQGLNHVPNQNIAAIRKHEENNLLYIETTSGQTLGPFEKVVFAIGRTPLLKDLNLSETGLSTDEEGFLVVDERQQTSTQGIYAVGDVTHAPKLTPTAIAGGRRLADRLFGNRPTAKADYHDVPTVVFSHPPLATIGMTEDQARAKFGDKDVKVFTSTFTNLWYGPWDIEPNLKPKTYMKLITTGADERVIGIHMTGMSCDEILQGFAVAFKMGACKRDFDRCVAIHPTAAEELVTMAPWGLSPEESSVGMPFSTSSSLSPSTLVVEGESNPDILIRPEQDEA